MIASTTMFHGKLQTKSSIKNCVTFSENLIMQIVKATEVSL